MKKLKPIVFAILIGVLLAIAAAVYSQAKNLNSNKNKADKLSSNLSNSKCPWKDNNFCQFFSRLSDPEKYYSGSFALIINSKNASGLVTTASWSTDGKGNSRIFAKENSKLTSDVILIEKKLYIKNIDTNAWDEQDLTSSNKFSSFNIDISNIKQSVLTKMIQKLTGAQVKAAGEEKCGNEQCYKYLVTVPGAISSSEYVYFDKNNYLLTKTTSQAKDGYSEESLVDRSSIDIKTPSPLK